MANDMPDNPANNRTGHDKAKSRIEKHFGAPIRELAVKIESLANEVRTDQERRDTKEDANRAKQFRWQKAYVVTTGCLSLLTLVVLMANLLIAAISLAPRVIVNANSPKSTDNILLVFTNLGNSSAYNVVILASSMWRTPEPNFDPFKSIGGTKLPPQTIDELTPSTTASSTFVFSKPTKGGDLYVYGPHSTFN